MRDERAMSEDPPRVAVIGLDGAHFELLQPWLEQGDLPHIESILESGVSGDLESVLPPVTSPNWKAYATGKNPGKLGIFWWENIDTANRRIHYPHERKNNHPEYWDILSEEVSVGVLGVPTTHPAREVGDFMISGAPDGEETGFASPPELEDELKDEYDYRVTAKNKFSNGEDEACQEVLDLIETRFEVGKELCERHEPDFVQITTFYINSLHHFLWDHEYTHTAWKRIDDHLGYFLDEFDDVVLMSDHGATKISYTFNINAWLQQKGYLQTETSSMDILGKLGFNLDRMSSVANSLGIKDLAKQHISNDIIRRIPDQNGMVKKEGKADRVDWKASRAVGSGQGPVYLIPPRDGEEYEQLQKQIMKELREVRSPGGQRIAEAVYRGEDVYSGPYSSEIPDIVIDQRPGIHIAGSVGRDEVFTAPDQDGWIGENKRHGLFAACGESFGTGKIDLSILDLAPTLLHLFGQPIPADMDGAVRKEVFADGANASKTAPEYTKQALDRKSKTAGDENDIEDRLEDLGYL